MGSIRLYVFSAAIVLGISGCSSSSTGTQIAMTHPIDPQIESALGELEALPTPLGVDEALMRSLKQALAGLLATRGSKQPSAAWPSYEDWREASLNLQYASDTNVLTWRYNNIGDYNLDGKVDIPDLIPVALSFNAVVGDGLGNEELEQWMDGTGFGVIDWRSIVPIAMNYSSQIVEYTILCTPSLRPGEIEAGTRELGHVGVNDRLPGWPLRYEFAIPEDAGRYIGLREVHGSDRQPARDYWWDTQDPYGGKNGYLYTNPHNGNQYYVIPGRVLIMFKVAVEEQLVEAFLVTENLEVAMCLPEMRTMGVYLPPDQTIEDAVLNWPVEYSYIISTVEPVRIITPD
jgi:hypothetical protein